jgi:hypothetical protein
MLEETGVRLDTPVAVGNSRRPRVPQHGVRHTKTVPRGPSKYFPHASLSAGGPKFISPGIVHPVRQI